MEINVLRIKWYWEASKRMLPQSKLLRELLTLPHWILWADSDIMRVGEGVRYIN